MAIPVNTVISDNCYFRQLQNEYKGHRRQYEKLATEAEEDTSENSDFGIIYTESTSY